MRQKERNAYAYELGLSEREKKDWTVACASKKGGELNKREEVEEGQRVCGKEKNIDDCVFMGADKE